ncbi:MAG: hypothetical protein KDD69_20105, partial [Bdellovibrionales bacterium]|nr:hypothetical protein [Bdellovibrionales bacterium]
KLIAELEGRTVTVRGQPVTLRELGNASVVSVPMSFKQEFINVLADPNIALLLGLGAMLGLGIELYHPGGILPGVFGAICLILSLVAGQVLPISYGGLALLALGAALFVVELFMPAFGIWGAAGVVCFVLGSIYLVDSDMIWAVGDFGVNEALVGSIAGVVGGLLLLVSFLAIRAQRRRVTTGKEGLVGKSALTKTAFARREPSGEMRGRVEVMGELWHARFADGGEAPEVGERLTVKALEAGMTLVVTRNASGDEQ